MIMSKLLKIAFFVLLTALFFWPKSVFATACSNTDTATLKFVPTTDSFTAGTPDSFTAGTPKYIEVWLDISNNVCNISGLDMRIFISGDVTTGDPATITNFQKNSLVNLDWVPTLDNDRKGARLLATRLTGSAIQVRGPNKLGTLKIETSAVNNPSDFSVNVRDGAVVTASGDTLGTAISLRVSKPADGISIFHILSASSSEALACRDFLPNGLTEAPDSPDAAGRKIWRTNDYKGATKTLSVTKTPPDATINRPTASPTGASFTALQSGNGYSVIVPENTSTAADVDYTVDGSISSGVGPSAATQNCPSFIIRVPKKSADTTCTARSTQVKFRSNTTENWSTAKTITLGDTVKVGGIHNNSSTLADDVLLEATGPEGPASQTIDLNNLDDTDTTNDNNISFKPVLAGTYTVTANTKGKVGQQCMGVATLTVNEPQVVTQSYRLAENPSDLAAKPWIPYTVEPMTVDFEFSNKTPGPKTIFVEFKDSKDTIVRHQANIKLLGPDPVIASCSLGFEGSNTVLTLTSEKNKGFGADKGVVKSGDTDLQVREWKDKSIKAVWLAAPEGQVLPVSLLNADDQIAEGQCSSISQLALGAKIFCRAPSQHQTNNVDLILLGDYPGGAKIKQKVSIDKTGIIQGLTQKLEAGKNYKVSLKAPKSLRRTISFTAEEGTTNISNFVFPVGDIFPADGGDGVINALDKSELNRQWSISGDAKSRSADFNVDGRVNSIDWACMRYDFSGSDDSEPAPGLPVSPLAPAISSSPISPNPIGVGTTSPALSSDSSAGVGTTANAGVGTTNR